MAGVAGSGNANHLQITFDESWDQYAKKITWWDAALQNPVQVILGGDKILDLIQDPRTYCDSARTVGAGRNMHGGH